MSWQKLKNWPKVLGLRIQKRAGNTNDRGYKEKKQHKHFP